MRNAVLSSFGGQRLASFGGQALRSGGRGANPFAAFLIGPNTPSLIFSPRTNTYAKPVNGKPTACNFSDIIAGERSSLAVQTADDGTLQWTPHNFVTQSEDFNDPAWAKSGATVSSNEIVAPDGNMTADKLVESTHSTLHFVDQSTSFIGKVTRAIFAKKGGRSVFRLARLSSNLPVGEFDLENETATAVVGDSATIDAVGDDWYLCTVTGDATGADSGVVLLRNGGASSYAGDGTSGIYIWGAHNYRSDLGGMAPVPAYQRGLASSDTYLPTTTVARYLPRAEDHYWTGAEWRRRYLKEPASTNEFLYSGDFSNSSVWLNTAVTVGANFDVRGGRGQTLVFSNSSSNILQNVGTVGVQQVVSIYVHKNSSRYIRFYGFGNGAEGVVFDIQSETFQINGTWDAAFIEKAGPNTLRLVGVVTPVSDRKAFVSLTDGMSGSVGASGTLYAVDPQFESGSGPTSYIPTAGSQVTRSADPGTIAAAVLPYSSEAMTITQRGAMTYADTGVPASTTGAAGEVVFHTWRANGANYVEAALGTPTSLTGTVVFAQEALSVRSDVLDADTYSPGINKPYAIAASHEATRLNGAVSGTALNDDTTPTALPDLSATNLELAFTGILGIEDFTIGAFATADADLAEATG
ncbi:phage head spike fiber domain-containing protein [Citreimonas sp.]|uniref:phage head spike fiber domain-containing protein n=1 Tax=Citreimonas sp. TaxID=3036715 RepID=UPI004059CF15